MAQFDFKEKESTFLTGALVNAAIEEKGKCELTIMSWKKFPNKFQREGQPAEVPLISFMATDKQWLIKSAAQYFSVSKAIGEDPDKWIGMKVRLKTVPTDSGHPGIRLDPEFEPVRMFDPPTEGEDAPF